MQCDVRSSTVNGVCWLNTCIVHFPDTAAHLTYATAGHLSLHVIFLMTLFYFLIIIIIIIINEKIKVA